MHRLCFCGTATDVLARPAETFEYRFTESSLCAALGVVRGMRNDGKMSCREHGILKIEWSELERVEIFIAFLIGNNRIGTEDATPHIIVRAALRAMRHGLYDAPETARTLPLDEKPR
jgi:hypothetical protein